MNIILTNRHTHLTGKISESFVVQAPFLWFIDGHDYFQGRTVHENNIMSSFAKILVNRCLVFFAELSEELNGSVSE